MKKWVWVTALLLSAQGVLWAQDLPASPVVTSATAGAPAPLSFDINIQAPEEIRLLLERHLELLRYRELTDLNDSELNRLIIAAQQNAQDLVATMGYFSPEIRIELQAGNGASGHRLVKLSVVPGEPTLVREVHIQFSGPITNDPLPLTQRQQIEDSWPMPSGARFTQANWDSAKQLALRLLTRQRFPTGQLSASLADIDPVTKSASLSLTLDSGPAYQLGDMVISGTQNFDNEIVTRLARLSPGDDYDQAMLVEAQQRLSDSGYFDSVSISLDTSGTPTAAPVRVQLREARLQKLVLGIGASTDSGPRLSAEHTHHKVPGIGWRAVSKVLLDRETRSLSTELTQPPNDSNWRWVTSALFQNQQIGSFDVNSERLRLGRTQNGDQIDRNYYLQFDRAHTATSNNTEDVLAKTLSVNYAVTRRNFDNLPFATGGWGVGAEVGGGTTLDSERDLYGRYVAHGLIFFQLGRSADETKMNFRAGRISIRGEVGAVVAKDGIALPSTQLFLTGGDNSVRGYGYHDIGVTLPSGLITAGRYLAMGSVEWQRPITVNGRMTDWEGTLFVDAGSVADTYAMMDAKVGVGAGARWRSPIGPLQIDLAYGVATQSVRLHLNVGFTF